MQVVIDNIDSIINEGTGAGYSGYNESVDGYSLDYLFNYDKGYFNIIFRLL